MIDQWTEALMGDLLIEALIGDHLLGDQRANHSTDVMEDLKVREDLSQAWGLTARMTDLTARLTTDSLHTKSTIPWTWTMIHKATRSQRPEARMTELSRAPGTLRVPTGALAAVLAGEAWRGGTRVPGAEGASTEGGAAATVGTSHPTVTMARKATPTMGWMKPLTINILKICLLKECMASAKTLGMSTLATETLTPGETVAAAEGT